MEESIAMEITSKDKLIMEESKDLEVHKVLEIIIIEEEIIDMDIITLKEAIV